MRSAVVLTDDVCLGDGVDAVHHTVERVVPAVDDIVISCQCEHRAQIDVALSAADYRLSANPVPGGWPVAGIRSGCRVARGERTFVTACDDSLDTAEITGLFEAYDASRVVTDPVQ